MFYVAVVCNQNPTDSGNNEGTLSCFVGESKDEVIQKGIAAISRWQTQYHVHDHSFAKAGSPYGPYRLLVGVLGEEAKFNNFTVVQL